MAQDDEYYPSLVLNSIYSHGDFVKGTSSSEDPRDSLLEDDERAAPENGANQHSNNADDEVGTFYLYSLLPSVAQNSSGQVLAVRAVILGSFCGVLVSVANVYLRFKNRSLVSNSKLGYNLCFRSPWYFNRLSARYFRPMFG
ncbi:hypothetical protein F4859DRAFT_509712 [Xylaria cf. heliscus]|nr:hypothetical protein F4859DRAFT_509712 [Xylaria cf. heliscus]